MAEGRLDGIREGVPDGIMDALFVGNPDGVLDGTIVGGTLKDGVCDGPGEGKGLPVGDVGTGEGCAVSVGVEDGTTDALGFMEGETEMVGAAVLRRMMPPPVPPPVPVPPLPGVPVLGSQILLFVGSVLSYWYSSGLRQKSPRFSMWRHSLSVRHWLLVVHSTTHSRLRH